MIFLHFWALLSSLKLLSAYVTVPLLLSHAGKHRGKRGQKIRENFQAFLAPDIAEMFGPIFLNGHEVVSDPEKRGKKPPFYQKTMTLSTGMTSKRKMVTRTLR